MRVISMFDWNGSLSQDVAADATKFGFSIAAERDDCMGFVEFVLDGSNENIDAFISYYNLEDEEG